MNEINFSEGAHYNMAHSTVKLYYMQQSSATELFYNTFFLNFVI